MKIHVILFAALAVCGLTSPLPAHAGGNEGGHGGDIYAMEFSAIGSDIANQLAVLQATDDHLFRKWNFTAEEFKNAVLGSKERTPTRVVSQERVYLRNKEVDATNDGEGLITLSRSAWREDQLLGKVRLVLHEYFGILGIEQDRYDASIDFSDFAVSTTKAIQKKNSESSFMINLFYGRVASYPSLRETDTCDPTSSRVQSAIAKATEQAQGRCNIAQQKSCQVAETDLEEIVSTSTIGVRYCDVLVIVK